MTAEHYPVEITLGRIDAELFLADLDDLAETAWLCAAGAGHVGANSEPALLAVRTAILARTDAFRSEHGLPMDRKPAPVDGALARDARD